MIRLAGAVLVLALAIAPPAVAHISVLPTALEAGKEVRLEIELPALPNDVVASGATISAQGLTVVEPAARVWRSAGETRFALRVRADADPGPLRATIGARYGATTVVFPYTFTVVPAAAEDHGSWAGRAAVAALAGVVLLGLALAWRHRRPLQEN